jgi:hypothetical protein
MTLMLTSVAKQSRPVQEAIHAPVTGRVSRHTSEYEVENDD